MSQGFCARHTRLLEDAIELRGLETVIPGVTAPAFDAFVHAQQAIVRHATHFAGKAAVDLLTGNNGKPFCPICFVNRNPAGVNCDDWVNNAGDEALAEDIRRRDRAAVPHRSLVVS